MNILIFIALVAIGFLGIFLGGEANNHSWMADCEKIGMHRSADKAYKCEVTK